MNRSISFALLAAGVLLLVFGINAENSFSSDVSRIFTGGPTDKAAWLLIGAVVLLVAGASGVLIKKN